MEGTVAGLETNVLVAGDHDQSDRVAYEPAVLAENTDVAPPRVVVASDGVISTTDASATPEKSPTSGPASSYLEASQRVTAGSAVARSSASSSASSEHGARHTLLLHGAGPTPRPAATVVNSHRKRPVVGPTSVVACRRWLAKRVYGFLALCSAKNK